MLLVNTYIANGVDCCWMFATASCTDAVRTSNRTGPNTSSDINASSVQQHKEDFCEVDDDDLDDDDGDDGREEGVTTIIGGI